MDEVTMDALTQLLSHRSIRNFSSREVPSALLDQILGAAARAPTAGNLQSYSAIITRDPERRADLFEIHFRQEMVLHAPVVVTICVDVRRNTRWMEGQGAEPGFLNFWGFLVGMADAWCATQNIVIAAEHFGLGTCPSGGTFIKALNLIDYFHCPRGVIPVATLVLGYPSLDESEVEKVRPRLPLAAWTHEERYSDRSVEALASDYSEREKIDGEYYKNLYGLEGVGHELAAQNLAQIYTRLKYKKLETALFSSNFIAALKRQGFL